MHIFYLSLSRSLFRFDSFLFRVVWDIRSLGIHTQINKIDIYVCLSTGPLFFWLCEYAHKCVPIPSVAFYIDHGCECVIWRFLRLSHTRLSFRYFYSVSSFYLFIIFGLFSQSLCYFIVVWFFCIIHLLLLLFVSWLWAILNGFWSVRFGFFISVGAFCPCLFGLSEPLMSACVFFCASQIVRCRFSGGAVSELPSWHPSHQLQRIPYENRNMYNKQIYHFIVCVNNPPCHTLCTSFWIFAHEIM